MIRIKNRRRGILIVLTLIVLSLMTMFLTAGLTLSQTGTQSAGFSEDQQLATEGAQAGVDYARTRLQEDPNWKGGTGDSITVNMPGQLWVRENRGNVIGIVGDGDRKCAFRIRFNYQNGGGTPDEGLADPNPAMFIPSTYVSANNLNSADQVKVYRAQSGGSWSVTDSSTTPYDCVRYSAVILCEGLAGPGIRSMSPTNLNPSQSNRRLVRRVAEVVMGRNLSQVGDAPIYGAQSITMNVANMSKVEVRSRDYGVPPRARTLQDMHVNAATTPTLDMGSTGEAFVNQAGGVLQLNGVDSTAPVAKQEDSKARFPNITWSQITKAPPTSTNLNAGTYVWRRTPRRLDYYAQEYDPAVGPPPDTVPADASFKNSNDIDPGGNLKLDKNRLELDITKDVFVNPVGGVKGIAVVPEDGLVAATENRPNVELQPAPSTPAPIITAQGDIFVSGSLRGEGSVTTEGNITFQGTSVIDADQNSRTAIYAKGDVNLEPMPTEIVAAGYSIHARTGSGHGSGGGSPVVAFLSTLPSLPFGAPKFQDIAFSGLFYTQGSIKANFPAGPSAADLYFRGMVVAFGGDPEAGQSAGDSGKGAIDFTGGNVYLEYDSRYVVGALNLTGAALLEVASYNLF